MPSQVKRLCTSLLLLSTLASCAEEIAMRHLVGLEYPPIAAQAQIQGRVVVKCTLRADGRVQSTEVLTGHPVLSKAARENASKWTFRRPEGPRPEPVVVTLTYAFRLEGVCDAPNCTSMFSFDAPDSVTVVTQARHWNPTVPRER